jgi:hypothetical protein
LILAELRAGSTIPKSKASGQFQPQAAGMGPKLP